MISTAGKRVLIFGDSLSYAGATQAEITPAGVYSAPGAAFAQRLLLQGASAARSDARVGRSAHNFWGREDTASLLAADLAWRPDVVFVMLGTNDLGLSMAVDGQDMARIRDAFRGTEVWGIGPPSFVSADLTSKSPAVVAMMRGVFGDKFVDSRPLTADLTGSVARTGDGLHFTKAGASEFGKRLAVQAPAKVGLQVHTSALPIAALAAAVLLLGAAVLWRRS